MKVLMKIKATPSLYPDYPEPVTKIHGCKVGWLYYRTREQADIASKAAIKEGIRKASLGYDYGYCSPGMIEPCGDTGVFAGMFRVCVP